MHFDLRLFGFFFVCPKKKPNREEERASGDAPRLGWAKKPFAFPISTIIKALQAD